MDNTKQVVTGSYY